MPVLLWPNGSAIKPRINDGFGPRPTRPAGARAIHYGADIGGLVEGQTMHAALDGEVIFAGFNGTLGWCCVIQTAIAQILYSHEEEGSSPSRSARVRQGDPVGRVGMTGATTGPHTCLRVFVGSWQDDTNDAVDPVTFFASHNTAAALIGATIPKPLERTQSEMDTVRRTETGDIFNVWPEGVKHLAEGGQAHISAAVQYENDKAHELGEEAFVDFIDAYAIPHGQVYGLGSVPAGHVWSAAHDTNEKLDKLLARK